MNISPEIELVCRIKIPFCYLMSRHYNGLAYGTHITRFSHLCQSSNHSVSKSGLVCYSLVPSCEDMKAGSVFKNCLAAQQYTNVSSRRCEFTHLLKVCLALIVSKKLGTLCWGCVQKKGESTEPSCFVSLQIPAHSWIKSRLIMTVDHPSIAYDLERMALGLQHGI